MPAWLAIGTGSVFLALFLWTAALNWLNVLNWLRGRKSGSSVPLVGGVCGLVGLIFIGKNFGQVTGHWLWLPLVLDWGSLPLLVWTLIFFVFVMPFRSHSRNSN